MSDHIQKNLKSKQQRQMSRRSQLRRQEKTIAFLQLEIIRLLRQRQEESRIYQSDLLKNRTYQSDIIKNRIELFNELEDTKSRLSLALKLIPFWRKKP